MRVYAYRTGHFLLPHSDHRVDIGRSLAYSYRLPSPKPPSRGELELFACDVQAGEITATKTALVIEPRSNLIVFFDVNDMSLRQVRDVMGELRISLAAWC